MSAPVCSGSSRAVSGAFCFQVAEELAPRASIRRAMAFVYLCSVMRELSLLPF
jgi:hypothetical protein